jgi:transcriptional regulator
MDALPDAYIRGMLRGIVPFEVTIARIEGKLKLSQNRPPGDQERVTEALWRRADGHDTELAQMMRTIRGG